MAKEREYMAKTMIPAERGPPGPFCVHFFVNPGAADRAYDVPVHEHGFWQLELGVAGAFGARVGGRRLEVRPGRCVFFPPGVRHGFSYPPGISYLSVKFNAGDAEGEFRSLELRDSPALGALERALLALTAEPAGRGQMIDCVISALFAAAYPGEPEEVDRDSLVSRVREYVRGRGGGYVSVAEVAGELGYSPSHISARFRREGGVALKTFLDRERGRRAAELVLYSDLNFGRIAYEMGFPDPFAFSRFFKRVHGTGPRAFRARGEAAQVR